MQERSASAREHKPIVAVFNGTQALGTFIMYNLAATSGARGPGARRVVLYRDNRPDRAFSNRPLGAMGRFRLWESSMAETSWETGERG